MAISVITKDEPPREKKGRVMPVNGIRPEMAARFMKACMIIQVTMPAASSREKLSGAPRATFIPWEAKMTKSIIKQSKPKKPNSSPMTAAMESVAGCGRYLNF